ncbi:MAG: hypothetical protein RL459_1835 [Pseudomonadota bacterium]|jgi:uncharacterized ferritin-like protein (DUF455 family)
MKAMNPTATARELRSEALLALTSKDIHTKVALTLALPTQPDPTYLAPVDAAEICASVPGRPDKPALSHPAKVPRRSPATLDGRAALIHAIAHIEFNAINLALDAVWRFDGMPHAFYADWAQVAQEEARHFVLLREHLRGLESTPDGAPRWDYGDFDAHDNLWAMCWDTRGDIVARMALVPRTMEARGLDATPLIQAKLRQVGTPDALQAVAILDIILREEVGHVAIGNHWYQYLCKQNGLDPIAHYAALTERYRAPRLKPPFNLLARRKAGFSALELDYLQGRAPAEPDGRHAHLAL